jgi:hypothetical protein
MSTYRYSISLYLGDMYFQHIYLYIRCKVGDPTFVTTDYNSNGPSGAFEKMLERKCRDVEREHTLPSNILSYSFPLELDSGKKYDDILPDYVY